MYPGKRQISRWTLSQELVKNNKFLCREHTGKKNLTGVHNDSHHHWDRIFNTDTQNTFVGWMDGWMDEREIWSVSRIVAAKNIFQSLLMFWLVHGQVTIIFVVSVGLSVCLFVCLCRVFLSRLWSDFDQTRTYVMCLCLVVSPRI